MQTLRHLLIAALAVTSWFTAPSRSAAADVAGRAVLIGKPPDETTIDMVADPVCAAAHLSPVKTRHYVVGRDGGLGDVFVYIKSGLAGRRFPVPTQAPVLNQLGCEYSPYVLGLEVNQRLQIRNSDPTLHTIHIFSLVNGEQHFAQTMKGQTYSRQFAKPETLVKVKCDVHPWMLAYLGIVDNPFYAVTGNDGRFSLHNVPPGKYTIVAVHPKCGSQTQTTDVAAGQDVTVSFTFQAKASP